MSSKKDKKKKIEVHLLKNFANGVSGFDDKLFGVVVEAREVLWPMHFEHFLLLQREGVFRGVGKRQRRGDVQWPRLFHRFLLVLLILFVLLREEQVLRAEIQLCYCVGLLLLFFLFFFLLFFFFILGTRTVEQRAADSRVGGAECRRLLLSG